MWNEKKIKLKKEDVTENRRSIREGFERLHAEQGQGKHKTNVRVEPGPKNV